MDITSTGADELTRRFIDSRASRIHNTFGVESHFNPSTSRYELKEFHDLTKALEQVKSEAPELVEYLEVDPTECTWDDVLIEVERARDAADICEKRSRKSYRIPFKWLGDHAHMIGPGLSAFPDQFGIIHGGLAVVLSIARHREQVRFKLLRAVETIPNAIHTAQSKERNFVKDETNRESVRLHRCLDDMRRTLLRTLPELIKRLNPETLFDKAANVFKGANIDHLLAEISSSAENVLVCARGLGDDRETITHTTVMNTHDIVIRTRGGVEDLQSQVREVLMCQKSLQSQLDAISGKNWLFQLLREYSKPQLHHNPPTSPITPAHTTEPPGITTTPFELLNILSVNHLTALNDEDVILKRGRTLPDEALSRTASMVKTRELQHLLHSPEPGIVLVDGCADRAQIARISPISFICANLAQALRQNMSPVLVFFCGQHVSGNPNDDLQGPQGLVRGLLSQLILLLVQNRWMGEAEGIALPFSASPPPMAGGGRCGGELYSEDHESDDMLLSLPDLCRLFHSLLALIPRDTSIFCIVDGISYYERDIWRGDYELVLAMFGDIVTDSSLGGLFKVLLTSPTNRMQLSPDLIPHQKIELRGARVDGGVRLGRRLGQPGFYFHGRGQRQKSHRYYQESHGSAQEVHEGAYGQSRVYGDFLQGGGGVSEYGYHDAIQEEYDFGGMDFDQSHNPLIAQYGQ